MATDNMPQNSPLAKLFYSDTLADKELQKIRDRIYYFAWSRDRRDEAKLDWVVSENGVNRNVHLRWIGEAPSGLNRNHIDGLSRGLLLVNKQLSADFTRFIYSVNDLDVLVDLKADHTGMNQAKLDTIVSLLENPNFQRYTRSARVRIHFPDKYPFQNLPVFNQHVLDSISVALDGFEQLTRLSVHVVPMQGPEVYELRLAAFPFYPMSMTNWSIRILNSRTCNWDFVGGEKLHHLNLAWDLFQDTGSLTAAVHEPVDAERPATQINQMPDVPKSLTVGQKKNGSQKRKGRKLKALSAVTAPSASKITSEVALDDLLLRSGSPLLDPSQDHQPISVSSRGLSSVAEPSHTKSWMTGVPNQSAGGPPDPVPLAHNAAGTAHQSSSPVSTTKLGKQFGVKLISASSIKDGAVETDNTGKQRPCPASPIDTAPKEHLDLENPQDTTPSSSVPSSVTLGRNQSEDEAATHDTVEETPHGEAVMRGAGAEKEKPVQKKRRIRKKAKKTQSTDTVGIPSNDNSGKQVPVESEDNGSTMFVGTVDAQRIFPAKEDWDGIFFNSQRPFNLSEIVEMTRLSEDERFFQYKRANGRSGLIFQSPDIDRLLRQKERMAARETERQAEKMRAKGKRKTKKVKEVMIRRKGTSDGLRRSVEDAKKPASGKQGSDLRKRFHEITGERYEKEVFASQGTSSEDFNSSDEAAFSPEESSPERTNYLPRESSTHHERLDISPIPCHRQSSSSSPSSASRPPGPALVYVFPNEDNTGEDKLRLENQNVEELEHAAIGYDDEPALFDSHHHNQSAMTGIMGHNGRRSDRSLSETAAPNVASVHQKHHQDRQMEEEHLCEELEDSDNCASVISQYGDDRPPSISDDEGQKPAA